MNPITVPRLYCPITPAVNPHAADVASRADAWVRRFDLYAGDAWQLYQDTHVTQLAARIFPTASPDRLALANDLLVILFALYDLLSGQHPALEPAQQKLHLRQITASISAITTGGRLPLENDASLNAHSRLRSDKDASAANPIPAAFADIWNRLQECCPPQLLQQFAINFLFLLKAAVGTLDNDHAGTPSISQYVESRRQLCAAPITMDLITAIEDIPLPHEIFQHPEIRQLVTLGRHIICWANDLFYLGRRYNGKGHNLIYLLQSERQLTLDEAILCTVAMHDVDMLKFMRQSKQLTFVDPAAAQYIASLGRHVRGNVDWSLHDTGRYYFRDKG